MSCVRNLSITTSAEKILSKDAAENTLVSLSLKNTARHVLKQRGSGNQSFNIKPHSIFGYRSEVLIVYSPRVSLVELKHFSCIP